MKKKIIIILLVLVALSSILLVNLGNNKSTAQECNDCTPIPTPPGDSDYSKINCNCTGAIPTIKASATTITPSGSITLWVDSGRKACPDFTWSVSSTKYTLNKSNTKNDLETVTMTAASGVCSATGYNNSNIYVTVTVTDRCGNTNQTVIRNTSGQWSAWTTVCGTFSGEFVRLGYPVGDKQYRVAFNYSTCDPTKVINCASFVCLDFLNNQAKYGFPAQPAEGGRVTNWHLTCGGSTGCTSPNTNLGSKVVESQLLDGTQWGPEYLHKDYNFGLQRSIWVCQ